MLAAKLGTALRDSRSKMHGGNPMEAYFFDKGLAEGLVIIVKNHGFADFGAKDMVSTSCNEVLVVNCQIYGRGI